MATTTATLSITSADLTTDALSLSSSKNLNRAGLATGLAQVEGVARKRLVGDASNAKNYVIADASDAKFTEDGAAKVYIKNLSTNQFNSILARSKSWSISCFGFFCNIA